MNDEMRVLGSEHVKGFAKDEKRGSIEREVVGWTNQLRRTQDDMKNPNSHQRAIFFGHVHPSLSSGTTGPKSSCFSPSLSRNISTVRNNSGSIFFKCASERPWPRIRRFRPWTPLSIAISVLGVPLAKEIRMYESGFRTFAPWELMAVHVMCQYTRWNRGRM
jgi:hypothetical protein